MDKFGTIVAVLPERSGTSAKGNTWRSASYVLETQEQYPKKIVFDVVNDKIDQFNIRQGDMLQVCFDIDAREYNGKWFNSVQAWRVVRQQHGGYQQQQPQGGYQQPGQQWAANNPQAGAQAIPQATQQAMRNAAPPQPQGEDDDLPF